jgi:hypothetical protein
MSLKEGASFILQKKRRAVKNGRGTVAASRQRVQN